MEGTPAFEGMCGIANLGNTSQLSCVLQGLMNTSITDFFLKDIYKNQINTSNLLGTGGELGIVFAELCKQYYSVIKNFNIQSC